MSNPNILWIMTDQQSFNMMSCAGNPYIRTPNMDRLARCGVRFERAYCSNPVCLPSRLGMFTGTYPGDAGVIENNSVPNEPWPDPVYMENGLGKLMTQAGYRAVYGGKEHFPGFRAADLGFEYLTADERDELAHVSADFLRRYDYEKPLFMVTSFINPHDICFFAINDGQPELFSNFGEIPPEVIKERHLPENIYEILKDFGKVETATMEQDRQLPPGMDPETFYATVCPPLPDNFEPAPDEPEAIDIAITRRIFKKRVRESYDERRWRLHRWCYKNLTERVDRQIGEVLSALDESGHFDDTVIIFVSDHGDIDASHRMEHKEVLFEEAVRVPLIIKDTGAVPAAGTTADCLAQTGTDLAVTILDYAGVTPPSFMTGVSLRKTAATGRPDFERDTTVIESEFGIGAVSKTGKYVCYDEGARNEQYYDRATNPGESFDQLCDPAFAGDVARLRAAVAEHRRRNGGQARVPVFPAERVF